MKVFRRSRLFIIYLAGLTIVTSLAVLAFILLNRPTSSSHHSSDMPAAPLVTTAFLGTFPQKSASSANVTRITNGIIPPTNSWLSGMVLQDTPLPVFPMPLSFAAKAAGFEIGIPEIHAASTVITGGHTPGINAQLSGATNFNLLRYDKTSATLRYQAGSKSLGELTLAEGSPFVFYRATAASTITLNNVGSVKAATSTYLLYLFAGHSYGVANYSGATLSVQGSHATITLPKGGLTSFYGLPQGSSDTLHAYAANQLSGVTVGSAEHNDDSQTTFTYQTQNAKPTVIVPMSYSNLINPGASAGSYESIYGAMKSIIGNTITTSSPLFPVSNALDLSHISSIHKNKIIADLAQDVAQTSFTAKDSYYSGKELARAANLLMIAEQLKQTEQSKALVNALHNAFSSRLGSNFFYYDPTLRGVAAQTNAFGSEDFNDHHFHYGYFIYAASILGKYDTSFVNQYQANINLLVADIASYSASANFPIDRNYDPYAQHSWAAGLAPFADGNNQESSSEAINAWNGVALWAALTHNSRLQSNAEWMLANEAATAKSSWRDVAPMDESLKGYTSPLSSLNFGGKRTYNTFFSDEPNAKLGIQLLPMSPAMTTLKTDGTAIGRLVNASISNDDFNVALGDYILMYYALASPQKAAALVPKQQSTYIDDGDSKTYLDAWVYRLSDQ